MINIKRILGKRTDLLHFINGSSQQSLQQYQKASQGLQFLSGQSKQPKIHNQNFYQFSAMKRTFDLLNDQKKLKSVTNKEILLANFESRVQLRYQLLNSLFQTLPVDQINETSMLIPILTHACQKGLESGLSPEEVIDKFFKEYDQNQIYNTEQKKIDFLFRVVQFVERQVVLVDALEDANYSQINDLHGPESLGNLIERIRRHNLDDELLKQLSRFAVRVVLTAHPTQFYPKQVLSIINDLNEAIQSNDITQIQYLLWQLAKTPFFQREKPTPLDEAQFLIQYLENVFYDAVGTLQDRLRKVLGSKFDKQKEFHKFYTLGFWPGGDRDGNPFVRVETTKKVAKLLRTSILKCYIRDVRQVKKRLSFKGIYELLEEIENDFGSNFSYKPSVSLEQLYEKLDFIRQKIITDHNGLFLPIFENFQRKVHTFGYHFASIDIRQDSRVLDKTFKALQEKVPYMLPYNFEELPVQQKLDLLLSLKPLNTVPQLDDEVLNDTLQTFNAMREIQEENGEFGSYRFIISNCRGPLDVAKVYAMSQLTGGWSGNSKIDVVPLFETIDDLKSADKSMKELFSNGIYQKHLKFRKMRQTIMCGFSDGTKDGGYLGANWGIYQAKENLSKISRDYGVEAIFFDGRGGPPARGGGNKHLYYASQGPTIENHEIQITIQGQTISSNFGVTDSCLHNLELLMSAGLQNNVLEDPKRVLTQSQRDLLNELSEVSLKSYLEFKNHPKFMPYLLEKSPLKYYGEANIGSRPAKRSAGGEMKFEDLRAIPFVGAWSQLKQNVPGFYGLGTALKKLEAEGRLNEAADLYKDSLFFKALVQNSMMSMCKTYFPLTHYMLKDKQYSEFWNQIYNEFQETERLLLLITEQKQLLDNEPVIKQSIKLREQIVLPLLTIQQFALQRINKDHQEDLHKSYQNLIIRSLFGSINATRNAA
ncbi:phosphoenolpyruvate carboxylase (macronuclear) [Tetrahymena thermophila SB210]|uniref:Phosphoenolpyruvate carboxylase n=1 Tax=Tetrahymena thermophila (strain SB210) TaxID=312017 RepID=Q23YQ3_TETTS|nr:phosphoenolpyruvate carboxylase [Tetrahymena thermophila SB210]EAS01669.2 phosphoenolpyruvate carboxylase [Tetrahymena thermophila SB210]|eukprot:XP_001021914.2 phosphoenolpyruvate carboxylase [Tetrahymena thermophila SB210]